PDLYKPPPRWVRSVASAYLGVFGRRMFQRWNKMLLTIAARGICVSDPTMSTLGREELDFMRRVARIPSPVIFDVGANVGHYSARLKELCPKASIWAFEPHPGTFTELHA